jgi:hypothetical protein
MGIQGLLNEIYDVQLDPLDYKSISSIVTISDKV